MLFPQFPNFSISFRAARLFRIGFRIGFFNNIFRRIPVAVGRRFFINALQILFSQMPDFDCGMCLFEQRIPAS